MKPVTLKVGERDERGRAFLGWRCKHASRHDACFHLRPTADEVSGHCCAARPVFRKESRYRKVLRELLDSPDPRGDGSVTRARKLLGEG